MPTGNYNGVFIGGLDVKGGFTNAALSTVTGLTLSFVGGSGTLTAATYAYRVSALTKNNLENIPCSEVTRTTSSTGSISLVWKRVDGASAYKVYGRTSGSEQLLTTITDSAITHFTDDGSLTPSGALNAIDSSANVTFSGTIGASNLSGTNTGDITLTAAGSSPNSNAASLSGQALTLQPADGSNPGIVSTTTQTFAGNKTFSGTIGASNLSGTNTGDVTLTAAGSSPNSNAASLSGQALTLQPANGSNPGIVSTTTQTFAGAKTFSNGIISNTLAASGTSGITYTSQVTSGTAVAHIFDTTNNLSNVADIIASFRNAGNQQSSIKSDGSFNGPISIIGGLYSTPLSDPTGVTLSLSTGTMTTGTYFYRVSALNSTGETGANNEQSLAITGPAGIQISWTAVPTAIKYSIYRGTVSSGESLLTTINSGSTVTFHDDGSLTPGGHGNAGQVAAAIHLDPSQNIGFGNAAPDTTNQYSNGFITGVGSILSLTGGANGVKVTGALSITSTIINTSTTGHDLISRASDGAGAIAHTFDLNVGSTSGPFQVPGSRLLSIGSQTTQQFHQPRLIVNNNGIVIGGINAINLGIVPLATPVNSLLNTVSTGGTLAGNTTYYYRVTAFNSQGETLGSTESSIVVPAGTNTNRVQVNWNNVIGATGYKIYGRSTGAEQLLTTLYGGTTAGTAFTAVVTNFWVDDGSLTPSGALPTVNTTGGISGGVAINQLSPPVIATVVQNGSGTLAANTYYYKVTALDSFGESLPSAEVSGTTVGANHAVLVTWRQVSGAAKYKIYGRSTGAEQFIDTVEAPGTSYNDTGSITPSGAMPSSNTTGGLTVTGGINHNTNSATGNITVATTDYYVGITGTSGATVTLPPVANLPVGHTIVIKDEGGNATASNIIVDANASELIDGQLTQTITVSYGSLTLIVRNGAWWII